MWGLLQEKGDAWIQNFGMLVPAPLCLYRRSAAGLCIFLRVTANRLEFNCKYQLSSCFFCVEWFSVLKNPLLRRRLQHQRTRKSMDIYPIIQTCRLNWSVNFTMLQCMWVSLIVLVWVSFFLFFLGPSRRQKEVLKSWSTVEFQADVETDEVYAQMTLQPLSPVKRICNLSELFLFLGWFISIIMEFFSARTKRYLSSCWVGCSKQTAYELFLQDINCKWY